MHSLKQPAGSNLCGQTCVAMLAEIEIEAACQLFHCHGKTTSRNIQSVLRLLGIRCGALVRASAHHFVAHDCIALLRDNDSNWCHWVLVRGGLIFDPADDKLPAGVHISSFIPFYLEV